MKFASSGACPTKASKNLEFLRMNLEFLRINSRIPRINLEFPKDEFRISRDCFASLAMTQGILDFILRQ